MAKISKKGIFFTFISLTIMAILIVIYTPQADITIQKDTRAERVRIESINNYVNGLENEFMITVMKATAQKTIVSLNLYVNKTQSSVKDFDAAFAEVMLNGTIDNAAIDSITGKKIMENNTVSNWTARFIEAGWDTYNVNTSIALGNVTASQATPWHVSLTLKMSLDVKSNLAEWKRDNVTLKTSIGIEGFHDPLYLMNARGSYSNRIKISEVEFNQWNITLAREHLKNGTYVHWQNSDGPSFIMRFSNTTTNSSCCGIESLVNPNMISPEDQIGSYVDYLFWNQTYISQCTQLYNITNPAAGNIGLWDEFRFFKLDIDHLTKYNITSEYAIRSC
ncbi:MAG TPA: hypothetical protein VJI52_05100 [Candidatus Nanoarchaeia archaeon]|nr:hypothetical protein [Candidatus Nanoarchaeia archaeon]